MNTAPSTFCDECGAALSPQIICCPVCQQRTGLPQLVLPARVSTSGQNNKAVPSFHTGNRLTQRYSVLAQIGSGGFGVVYVAKDRYEKNRLVAIKQINLDTLSSQDMIEATDSYNREVTLLSKLKHPHLPCLYDHFTDARHWYIVMEYIEGETLEDQLKKARKGYLSVRKVIEIGITLCEVLQYLHTQHPPIIFRDVKPGNIMCSNKGQLYLIDFGIARRYDARKSRDTGPLGSPGYAAPEQYGIHQTIPQTDMYGLGATLQTLLTGKEPLELIDNAEHTKAMSNVPAELQKLLELMLDQDSRNRPQSMQEVRRVLENCQLKIDRNRKKTQKIVASIQSVLINKQIWQLFFIAVFMVAMVHSVVLLLSFFLACSIITARSLSELYAEAHWTTARLSKKMVFHIFFDSAKGSLPYILYLTLYSCILYFSADSTWFVIYLLVFICTAGLCISINAYWLVKLLQSIRRKHKKMPVAPLEQFQYHAR